MPLLPDRLKLDAYTGYKGLPPLVNLTSVHEAVSKGLPVEDVASRLKRIHWALREAHKAMVAHIAGVPIYELKMAFSLHSFYCAEHIKEIEDRIREMRQPPYGLETPPTSALELFGQELIASPSIPALLLGLYQILFPAIQRAIEKLMGETNKLFDHPTYRLCRHALLEIGEVNAYGAEALDALVSENERRSLSSWMDLLCDTLATSGTLDGTAPFEVRALIPYFSSEPHVYDGTPRRDERFIDPYNMGVNAEALLFDPDIAPLTKTLVLFYKRMREINVPEVLSSILTQTVGKPWEYYRCMTRQMWDEARHAMMGEVGFVALGIDWTKLPFDLPWSHNLNICLAPLERHAVLFTIEQGLMPRERGKQYEWEVAIASAFPLAAMIQDYDWADEILHARIGRDWLVSQIGSQQETLAFGDKAWSRAVESWSKWKERGLTDHRNWWPDLYLEACTLWQIEPDPKTLSFHLTYEGIRPDQKLVAQPNQ